MVKISFGQLLAIVVIAIILWYYLPAFLPKPAQVVTTSSPVSNLVSATKPIKFFVQDVLKGQAVASASVKVYQGTQLVESLTSDSTGMATTGGMYSSGTVLNVLVVSSNSKQWFKITVPQMSPADAQSLTVNQVVIPFWSLGSFTIKVTDQFGNTYSSGGAVNFTTLGVSSVSITVTIYNTVDNTGYKSSFDPINNVNWYAVLSTSTGGSAVAVSGLGSSVMRGTTTYYLTQVSDDGLTRQLVGQTYTKTGVTSVTFTVNKGSLAHGSSQTFTLALYAYFDPQYFATNGIGSPDALQLTSFALNFAA
jgi:hypothetical protein